MQKERQKIKLKSWNNLDDNKKFAVLITITSSIYVILFGAYLVYYIDCIVYLTLKSFRLSIYLQFMFIVAFSLYNLIYLKLRKKLIKNKTINIDDVYLILLIYSSFMVIMSCVIITLYIANKQYII
jgi:hypothetical protein